MWRPAALRVTTHLTNVSVALLTVGFICIASSDSVYTYLTQIGNYDSGSLFDIGWVVGYTLIAVGGILAAGRQINLDSFAGDSDRRQPLWQTIAIYATLIPVAALLFLYPSGWQLSVDIALLIGFVCLVGLVLGRQIVYQLEHDRVRRQTDELTLALQNEARVLRMQSLQSDRVPGHR